MGVLEFVPYKWQIEIAMVCLGGRKANARKQEDLAVAYVMLARQVCCSLHKRANSRTAL